MGEADIPASPYLLSINPGMVMQSFVTLGNLCLDYSPYYNIGLFFPCELLLSCSEQVKDSLTSKVTNFQLLSQNFLFSEEFYSIFLFFLRK